MQVRFYVADDGEVLSSKEYPVRKPFLMVPVMDGVHYVTEEHVAQSGIKTRVFRAFTIEVPEASK